MAAPVNPLTRATTANYGVVILARHGEIQAGAVIQSDDPRMKDLATLLSKLTALATPPATSTPALHATTHKAGGTDKIKLDELEAPSAGTTLDATTLLHGLMAAADKAKLDGLHPGGSISIVATVPGAGVGLDNDAALVLDDFGVYYKTGGAWTLFGHVAKAVSDRDVTFKTPTAGDGTADLATI